MLALPAPPPANSVAGFAEESALTRQQAVRGLDTESA